jgi:hypothetical protein
LKPFEECDPILFKKTEVKLWRSGVGDAQLWKVRRNEQEVLFKDPKDTNSLWNVKSFEEKTKQLG